MKKLILVFMTAICVMNAAAIEKEQTQTITINNMEIQIMAIAYSDDGIMMPYKDVKMHVHLPNKLLFYYDCTLQRSILNTPVISVQ